VLYLDDGHSMDYASGGFLRQRVRCAATDDGLEIAFDAREGRYAPWWKRIEVVVHGWKGAARVEQDGRAIEAVADADAGTLRFAIDDQPAAARIVLRAAP
jgi:alpha-glucosidase